MAEPADMALIFGPASDGEAEGGAEADGPDEAIMAQARHVIGSSKAQALYDLICEVIEAKSGKAEPMGMEKSPESKEY